MILFILSLIAGIAFVAAGIYFLSEKFLQRLNSASREKTEASLQKNSFRAKGSGYVAISLGAFTIVWAILLICFPAISNLLALIYMIFLVVALAILMIAFR